MTAEAVKLPQLRHEIYCFMSHASCTVYRRRHHHHRRRQQQQQQHNITQFTLYTVSATFADTDNLNGKHFGR